MEKEFVPYEESLELKQLDFDEPCFAYYIELRNPSEGILTIDKCENNIDGVLAPTFSQAFRWFDEVHGLTSTIDWMTRKQPSHSGYIVYFRGKEIPLNDENFLPIYGDTVHGMYVFKTRQEAELACLRELIKIVKNG